jgi:hypothetical protein
VLVVALVAVVATGGCTSFADSADGSDADPGPAASDSAGSVVTTAPEAPVTVVADPDPVEIAVATSRALFDRSPVVVTAPVGDGAAVLLGASAAVGLGVPLLLEPDSVDSSGTVTDELARLGADTVLAVGQADAPATAGSTAGPDVVPVPASRAAVAEVTGLDLGETRDVREGREVAAVAALDPAEPVVLQPGDAPPVAGEAVNGPLPAVERGDPVAGTVVLATPGADSVAAVGTARAAGVLVVVIDASDPRDSLVVREALAEAAADAVVAVGTAWTEVPGVDWKFATALAGDELPGGGQLLFPERMLVALYGHPGSPALGVLGEQGLDDSIKRAREHAAEYGNLVHRKVVPAFEIIATVASSAAGPDGNYSAESDPEDLRPWVEAAGEAGIYVLLDLQPGRTDFLTQAEQYRSLLELPHVGLALDPEWRLRPDQVHLTEVGSVSVDEVNQVAGWLADLTRELALPQKLFVVHQFRQAMLPERERLDMGRDELAMMIHVDGQGSQGDKQATWQAIRQGAPPGVFWGWKNFYDEDQPMLTPQLTVAQVDPLPELISYQ